jgi:deazaflavin-dependent oxidoreductase (nitroreductase family)
VQDRVRVFNKHVLNPLTLRFAGRPGVPYGVVRHVGRRSGRGYDTPVLVGTVEDTFVVPLPYGSDVDWYRNVRAADGCTVVFRGRAYRAESPELIPPSEAERAFPDWLNGAIQRAGAERYLRLERGNERPDAYRTFTGRHLAAPALAVLAGVVLLAVLSLWRSWDHDG